MERFRSGNGATWLDLLSTQEGRYRGSSVDRLTDRTALAEWLSSAGLSPIEPVTDEDLAHIRELRESLHGLAAASISGRAPHPADVRTVNSAISEDRGLHLRGGATGLRVDRPRTARDAGARLAREAVVDLTGPRQSRLRACGDDTCSGIFLDPTGRRRWCTDERCGNRLRVRAHRARTAGDREDGS
jgi:predicted RNA-binding Zn ribbon-like protein